MGGLAWSYLAKCAVEESVKEQSYFPVNMGERVAMGRWLGLAAPAMSYPCLSLDLGARQLKSVTEVTCL